MQLKDFISNALIEICSGIAEAKAQIGNGAIAPATVQAAGQAPVNSYQMELISFEVCVTVGNEDSHKNNKAFEIGLLQVVSAKIGKNANDESKSHATHVHKVMVSVPYMPAACIKYKN